MKQQTGSQGKGFYWVREVDVEFSLLLWNSPLFGGTLCYSLCQPSTVAARAGRNNKLRIDHHYPTDSIVTVQVHVCAAQPQEVALYVQHTYLMWYLQGYT